MDIALGHVVVKVDADVSFDSDYFERVMEAFEGDRLLGMASGVQLEWVRGKWRAQHQVGSMVAAPLRAYRRECLDEVLPLVEHIGWDGVDHVRARMNGWRTAVLGDAAFYHHRREGARQGRWSYWWDEGLAAHYLHYRAPYLLLRVLYRAWREPSAAAMAFGYASAIVRRLEQYPDTGAAGYIRRRQRLREWHARARQARGIPGATNGLAAGQMSDRRQAGATNMPLLARDRGPLYERIEAITPTPVKSASKRVYHRIRRRYNRLRFIERERFVEFGYRFRYDRREPYTTRVGTRTIVEDFNVWNAALGNIVVGRRCWFGLNNVLMGPVEIGDDLSTGQFVAILGPRKPSPLEDRLAREKTIIGTNVWISSGAIVLFGVAIGDNAVIGAGAIVTADVPANTMYLQRPRSFYLPLDETQIRRPEVS